MSKDKDMDRITSFYKNIEKILNMKIRDFLEKYKELLPMYEIVEESTSVDDIIAHFQRGVSYLLVTGKNKKLKGGIAYSDFLNILGRTSSTALSSPFSSVSRSLRRSRIPLESFKKLIASDILFSSPPCISEDSTIREALEFMYKSGTHYIVIVNNEKKVTGILTLHSIFRAIVKDSVRE